MRPGQSLAPLLSPRIVTNPGFCSDRTTSGVVQVLDGMVRLGGVEPPTLGLEVRRSIQLSYRRIKDLASTGEDFTTPCADVVLKSSREATASRRRSGLRWAYRRVIPKDW